MGPPKTHVRRTGPERRLSNQKVAAASTWWIGRDVAHLQRLVTVWDVMCLHSRQFIRMLDESMVETENEEHNCWLRYFCIVGMEDEICPYATFHLLGFREENMDPTKGNVNFQTFPSQNGSHTGTLGHSHNTGTIHQRSGSQSMVTTVNFSNVSAKVIT